MKSIKQDTMIFFELKLDCESLHVQLQRHLETILHKTQAKLVIMNNKIYINY
jgi:hypothetical protein